MDRSATRTATVTDAPGWSEVNAYRGQLDAHGRVAVPGLVAVGDAVCTTTPMAGRGVAMAFGQVRRLVDLVGEHAHPVDLASAFDAWCTDQVRPWYADHVRTDGDRVRRWAGGDVDLARPLPSDLVVDAAAVDPAIGEVVGPYADMLALPDSLDAVQDRARAVYARGWRPPVPEGPSVDDLAGLAADVLTRAA